MGSLTPRGAKNGGQRPGRLFVVGCCLVAVVAPCQLTSRWLSSFAASGQKGPPRIRSSLPQTYELPPEEPEPEEVEKEPPIPRRLPYTMRIRSHMAGNDNIPEDKGLWKFIEAKISNSLENTEDLIQNVEVRFQVSENFRKEKKGVGKVRAKGLEARASKMADEDDEAPAMVSASELQDEVADNPGSREIAPYHFEVTVELKNKRQVVLSKAKHAQPTLPEALDHTADALRNLMKAEKERHMKKMRQPKVGMADSLDELDMEAEVNDMYAREEEEKLQQAYREN